MFFEEFIEQHRVHLVVPYTIRLAFLITYDQIRINFFYIFSDQPELRYTCRIYFLCVTKTYRFETIKSLTGMLHRFEVLLKAAGGCRRAQLATGINQNADSAGRGCSEDIANEAAVTDVLAGDANADRIAGSGKVVCCG